MNETKRLIVCHNVTTDTYEDDHGDAYKKITVAAPKVELPTEFGWYITANTDTSDTDQTIMSLDDDGWTFTNGGSALQCATIWNGQTGLVRLERASTTAKAIHARLRELNRITACSDIERFLVQLSTEFGVTDD
jgi:hypothetical protein